MSLSPYYPFFLFFLLKKKHPPVLIINTNSLSSPTRQCWIFVELVFVYAMYVETRGPTLEELAKVIDGDDAAVGRVDIHPISKDVSVEEFSEKI